MLIFFCFVFGYQSAIVHGFTSLIYDEFSVLEEGFGGIAIPESDDAEIIVEILYILGFYQIRVPLLLPQNKETNPFF